MGIRLNVWFLIIVLVLGSCGSGSNFDTNLGSSEETTQNANGSTTTDNIQVEENTTSSNTGTTPVEDNTQSENTPIDEGTSESLNPIFREFNVGFGGSGSFGFESVDGDVVWLSAIDLLINDDIEKNSYYTTIKSFNANRFDILQQKLKGSKYIVFWITKSWEEVWFSASQIQEAMDEGYIPVFNYWYFGDGLSSGLPSEEKTAIYYEHNIKVAKFLKQLKGTKFVVMEPEFNKKVVVDVVANQHTFASIMGHAIDTLRVNLDDETFFSLCMMDTGSTSVNSSYESCGYSNCALGDRKEWGKPYYVYKDLLDKLDFISFNQLVGQFSRDDSNPGSYHSPNPKASTNDEVGIDLLAARIENLTKFLKEKYAKPVFMPYVAIATATWNDSNNNGSIELSEIDEEGWESEANRFYTDLMNIKEDLLQSGLFGFAVMSLFDNPRNDYGGYQYLMNNEYHLGIIKTSAIDEEDKYRIGDIEFKKDIVDIVFEK